MFDLFLSPSGRITRTWYWLGFLIQAILLIPLGFQLYAALQTRDREAFALSLLGAIAFLVWSSFCITAKRLHDRGKPAWIYAFQLVPVIGIWVVIECGFMEGDAGANAYGPPPGALPSRDKKRWDAPEEADNSAAIDAMIARSLKAKAAPPQSPVPAGMPATAAMAARSPSLAPVFGRRR